MATSRRIASDLFRLTRGAVRTCRQIGREAACRGLPARDRLLDRLGLVPREEFDAVRELAENARLESERLAERIAGLETGGRKRTTRRRGTTRKAGESSS